MKFFNSRIVTKTVQLADALKAEKKPDRKLDEVLADIKSKGQVKTAGSEAQVKTAEKAEDNIVKLARAMVENPTKENIVAFRSELPPTGQAVAPTDVSPAQGAPGEVAVEEGKAISELRILSAKSVNPEVKAILDDAISRLTDVQVKPEQAGRAVGEWSSEGAPAQVGVGEAPARASSEKEVKEAKVEEPKAEKQAKKELPPEFLENIKGKKKDEGKKEKEEAKCADNEAKCAESAPKTLKMAKSLDFRQWAAEDVVTAWGQHGSFDKCVANVDGLVNEPKTYCKLLQVASGKADAIVKTAAAKKTEKKAAPKGVFKKLAKLSDDELAFLKEYWRNLYGDEYVASMTKDY